MLALADLYMGRDANGHYNNSTDVRVAVNCVDQPRDHRPAKVVDEDRRIREVAPFMSYGEFTGIAPLGTCAFWPVPATTASRTRSTSRACRRSWWCRRRTTRRRRTRRASIWPSRLGGTLLTFDGTQHTVVFQGNSVRRRHRRARTWST